MSKHFVKAVRFKYQEPSKCFAAHLTKKKKTPTFPATLPIENPLDAGCHLRCISYAPPPAVKGCPVVGTADDRAICKGKGEDRCVVRAG